MTQLNPRSLKVTVATFEKRSRFHSPSQKGRQQNQQFCVENIYTWNPNYPCFGWKRPSFGGKTRVIWVPGIYIILSYFLLTGFMTQMLHGNIYLHVIFVHECGHVSPHVGLHNPYSRILWEAGGSIGIKKMWHNRFHAEQAANGFMRIGGGHWLSVKVVKLCAPLGTASRWKEATAHRYHEG